ncbi:MAG TPA: DsrE/DsrF/DrsH-like family protein [Candidatus Limnocylindrales bacterium]|nr:DsrE/DsrF/DrsH-like family protein [Candidatus Limnocylindrales bacterium]
MTVELEPRPATTLPPVDPLAEAIADVEGLPEPRLDLAIEPEAKAKELTIVNWSGDFDKVLPVLILSSTAAASGVTCRVFITFWGLLPFVKDQRRVVGENVMQKMMSFMQRPGIDHVKLSKMQFMGMGPWMMKKLMKQYNIATPRELLDAAMAMGVEFIPCQMTMDMFGLKPDDMIEGLGEPAGAATVIELITNGDGALFI